MPTIDPAAPPLTPHPPAETRPHRRPPGPGFVRSHAWLASAGGDVIGLFRRCWGAYGDVFRYYLGRYRETVLVHPEHVKHVLQENHTNYEKSPFYDALEPLMGNGLVLSEGPFWLRQRRLAQPAFRRDQVAGFMPVIARATDALLERWAAGPEGRGEPFDVSRDMSRLTLEVVTRTLLGAGLTDEEAARIGRGLDVSLAQVMHVWTSLFVAPAWLPTPRNRRARAAIGMIDGVVNRIISDRRAARAAPRVDREGPADAGRDLLDRLLDARDPETGSGMSDRQLRDELVTIILAGHETTANTLAWAFFCLGGHPEADRALHDEARAVAGRAVTADDLPRLRYATMVVEETMRLYPPVWGVGRIALEDDDVGGIAIPGGTWVGMPQVLTHRHPDFWPDADRFDPERFRPDRAAARAPFSYFPFGGGPRLCIGSHFALTEATLALASIAARWRLELVPGQTGAHQAGVTLRPKNGLWVRLVKR